MRFRQSRSLLLPHSDISGPAGLHYSRNYATQQPAKMVPTPKWVHPPPQPFSDHIYKTAHGVSVPLRVFPSTATTPHHPWLIWVHGGGWGMGRHGHPNGWLIPSFRPLGYHIVSIGYRLAPHVSLMDQVEDLQDAFKWCRANLPSVVGEIDIDHYVVGGDSAGGTFSTLLGAFYEPKPKVVIDLYGVVDLADPHYYAMSNGKIVYPATKENTPSFDAELQKAADERDPSKAAVYGLYAWELPPEMPNEALQSFLAFDYTVTDADHFRLKVNNYTGPTKQRMTGVFHREKLESEEAFYALIKKYSSIHLLSAEYPPTFILHGTGDESVPVEQSYRFEKALKGLGVVVDSRYQEGGYHTFDDQITVSSTENPRLTDRIQMTRDTTSLSPRW